MIVCAGSIALDTTHTPFKSAKRILGGSASYFGIASSFFTKPALVSAVGSDFPEDYWRALEKHCDLTGVERAEGKTFFFESKFDFDLGNRTALGLEEGVFPSAKWSVPEYLQNPEILFLNSHHPAVDATVLKQMRPRLVFGDTIEYLTRQQKPVLLEFLKKTDGYVLNETEARILSGEANLIKAGKKLQALGPEMVVVKKGEHGGLLFYGSEVFPFPALPLENIVDPTGAGDCFAGGFLGWIDKQNKVSEKVLRQACYYGTVMASFCVEAFGLNNMLVLEEKDIHKRLNEYHRIAFCEV